MGAAAAEAGEEHAACPGDLLRACRTVAPRERLAGQRERVGIVLLERRFLVSEDRCREQVEKAVLVVVPERLVQTRRGLERHLETAAGLDELRERGNRRHGLSAAAHLGPEPELAELEDPERDVVPQWELYVDLRSRVEQDLGVESGSLDRLDPLIRSRKPAGVEDDGQPERLVTELAQLLRRAHEPVDDPSVADSAHAAVLGQSFVERKLFGRKRRSVVDQACEQGSARVALHHASVNVHARARPELVARSFGTRRRSCCWRWNRCR